MARIVPSDIARLELAGANRHEIATLRVLQARLPDDYTVFHGVHWTREWASETVFGELDFAVINRAGKALLVEQKNGTLEETEDDLIAHYADRSKSVVRQVQRALDNVRDKFRRTQGGRAIELDYLIYCPAHRLVGINAAALDPSRVVDATQCDRFRSASSSAWGLGTRLGRPGPRRCGPSSVKPSTSCRTSTPMSRVRRRFTRLSGGLVRCSAASRWTRSACVSMGRRARARRRSPGTSSTTPSAAAGVRCSSASIGR